jgi:hypothetical protein
MRVLALELLIPVSLMVGLVLAVECGYRLGGRRSRGSDAAKAMETGAIQGAMLGLLGLLLGFSFAGAAGRFMERQDLITTEANAISTAYLRADLLGDPHASDLRGALTAYVAHRVEASARLQTGLSREDMARVREYHAEIWSIARAGVADRPGMTNAIVGPVNAVIDLHATRMAAGRKHLPGLVIGLLLLCSVLTLGVIGYASGMSRRRSAMMTTMIAMLISAALWTTFDLDHPRIGLIRLSDLALQELDLRPVP